jgi:outer membrane receptor for ferrienterochelin and colicins
MRLLIIVLVGVAVPRLGFADGLADEADLQFQIGAEAYRKADYTTALEHFLASNRLVANRNVMFNIARSYEQLGKFPESYRYYVDALRGEPDQKVISTVEAALERVTPKVAVVEVNAQPTGAVVYLDRRDLGSVGTTPARLGLSGGTYKVIIEAPGYEPYETSVTAQVGGRTKVEHELTRILGGLEIGGDPGIEVRLDDETGPVSCITPCKLDAPPGPHVLHFTARNAAIAPRPVTIEAKKTIKVKPELVPLTGSILVSADEANALVEIDGEPRGFTPTVIPIGKRNVRLSLSGYESVERVVEVRASTQTDLRDVQLVALRQVSAASRETESVEDAPASVSIITAQELEAFAYPTILEALRGTRGVSPTFDSIYGNITVRGLGQPNDYTNRLLVLSDGMTLNENVLYQPFLHFDGRTDLGDVDRIEIVRGPGSVLYGTGAVSGVINLVLRGRDEPTSVQGGISSYNDAVARGRVAVTYRQKDYGFWTSLAGARSDGRTESLVFPDSDGARPTPHPVDGFDQFHSWTTTGKAWWKALTLQWFYTAREIKIPTGSFGSIYDRLENRYQDRRGLVELKFEPKIGDNVELLARVYSNYNFFHLDYLFDAVAADGVTPYEQPYQETYPTYWSGAEARVRVTIAKGLKISIGSEVVDDNQVEMHSSQKDENGVVQEIMNIKAPYRIYAGYGILEFRPNKRLLISAGARVDRWDLSQDQKSEEGRTVTADFTAINPRVAVIMKPTDSDIVKLMGGRAFRAPSTYEYFYTDGGVTQVQSSCCLNAGETLQPEVVYSVEAEYTHKFTQDWSILGSIWGTYATNIMESVPVPEETIAMHNAQFPTAQWLDGIETYRNSPIPLEIAGVDLELRKEWRAGTMLAASYGYLYGRYRDPPPDDPNQNLPNAPTHYASFRGVTPLVPNLVNGALRVTFEDARRISPTNDAESPRAVIADVVLSGRIARYGLRYAVGVYNLFNWQYSLPANPFPSDLMPQAGRSLMFNLLYTRELTPRN